MILAIRSDKKTLTFDSNDAVTTALTVSTSDNSYANGTFCQINTLEVHRGWNLTTQIDHRGLYLSENAVIEVSIKSMSSLIIVTESCINVPYRFTWTTWPTALTITRESFIA